MTAILSLMLLVVGVAMIVGARETAKKIGLGILGATIGLSLARCLVCWLAGAQPGVAGPASAMGWFWPVVVLVLIAVGALAWKARAFRQRRLDDVRRRQTHPRRLAPLPPPTPSLDHHEDLL